MWVALIKVLLNLVVLVINHRNDEEMKQIGEDRVIAHTLAAIAVRTNIARKIEVDSASWSDEHVNDILRKYERANEDSDK